MTAIAGHRQHQHENLHPVSQLGITPTPAAQPTPCRAVGTLPGLDLELPVEALRDVFLAAARLEGLQWELDTAEEELRAALRRAATSSVDATALARAAGITATELENYLHQSPLGAEAPDSPLSITAP
jgi:hypothetical protein